MNIHQTFTACLASVKKALAEADVTVKSRYLGNCSVVVLFKGPKLPFANDPVSWMGQFEAKCPMKKVATDKKYVIYHRDKFLEEFDGKSDASILKAVGNMLQLSAKRSAKQSANEGSENSGAATCGKFSLKRAKNAAKLDTEADVCEELIVQTTQELCVELIHESVIEGIKGQDCFQTILASAPLIVSKEMAASLIDEELENVLSIAGHMSSVPPPQTTYTSSCEEPHLEIEEELTNETFSPFTFVLSPDSTNGFASDSLYPAVLEPRNLNFFPDSEHEDSGNAATSEQAGGAGNNAAPINTSMSLGGSLSHQGVLNSNTSPPQLCGDLMSPYTQTHPMFHPEPRNLNFFPDSEHEDSGNAATSEQAGGAGNNAAPINTSMSLGGSLSHQGVLNSNTSPPQVCGDFMSPYTQTHPMFHPHGWYGTPQPGYANYQPPQIHPQASFFYPHPPIQPMQLCASVQTPFAYPPHLGQQMQQFPSSHPQPTGNTNFDVRGYFKRHAWVKKWATPKKETLPKGKSGKQRKENIPRIDSTSMDFKNDKPCVLAREYGGVCVAMEQQNKTAMTSLICKECKVYLHEECSTMYHCFYAKEKLDAVAFNKLKANPTCA